MINALDLQTYVNNWWDGAGQRHSQLGEDNTERTPMKALLMALIHMQRSCLEDYSKLKTEAAKVGHYRQLFTIWKAFCTRLPTQRYYDKDLPAVRAFPIYFEQIFPDLYYVLYTKNVFLGVKFTEEDVKRVKILEQELVKNAIAKERQRSEAAFFSMFMGSGLRGAFR